jgi:hypothetical protein
MMVVGVGEQPAKQTKAAMFIVEHLRKPWTHGLDKDKSTAGLQRDESMGMDIGGRVLSWLAASLGWSEATRASPTTKEASPNLLGCLPS